MNLHYKTFILGDVTSKAMGKKILIQNLWKILLYSQNEIWGVTFVQNLLNVPTMRKPKSAPRSITTNIHTQQSPCCTQILHLKLTLEHGLCFFKYRMTPSINKDVNDI